jgi:hypothetical protein
MVMALVKARKVPGETAIPKMKGTTDSTTLSKNKPTKKVQESQ